jgi:hypothetical protein
MATLILPAQLASLAGGRQQFAIAARTLQGLFDELHRQHPMVRSQLFDTAGRLRQFVGLFVDDRQYRLADGLEVDIGNDSQVLILFAVAGG